LLADAPPFEALKLIGEGAFSGKTRFADTLMAWAPVAIAAAGLVVTFAAGLWNIGVEGQIVAGAIAASLAARTVPGGRGLVLTVTLLAGVVGGALWGGAAGVLKVKGRVNEIFGGIGLGFVAQAFATYLIIGPWKRAGVASTSGTEPFRPETWLPTAFETRLAPIAIGLAVAMLIAIGLVMRGTRFGLRLRAVGSNPASARLLGVPADATTMRAFLVGGGLAGLAGAVIVTGVQHKLVPAGADSWRCWSSCSPGFGFAGSVRSPCSSPPSRSGRRNCNSASTSTHRSELLFRDCWSSPRSCSEDGLPTGKGAAR
jgi:ABC-type uncharacterized transport system permease subunit